MFSSSVEETRLNECKECGSSRGAIGSQEPFFGVLILMRICQLIHKNAYISNYNKSLYISQPYNLTEKRKRKSFRCMLEGEYFSKMKHYIHIETEKHKWKKKRKKRIMQ